MEKEVRYLGHGLSQGKKKSDADRVSGILALSSPKTKKEVRQLLGLLGYCRPWIEGFSEKAKFLHEKLTGEKIKWNEEDEEKLRLIKKTLIEAPLLSLPDLERPFDLFVNVSNQTAYVSCNYS